jgi:hypothetical protein
MTILTLMMGRTPGAVTLTALRLNQSPTAILTLIPTTACTVTALA